MTVYDEEIKKFLLRFTIAGTIAVIVKTVVAPIDRIKIILQTQSSSIHVLEGTRKKYNGFIDCLIRCPQEQGLMSFWRGNAINLIRYIPLQALNFSFNDFYKESLTKLFYDEKDEPSHLLLFIAGGLAGASATTIVFPLEFCQTRLAGDMGTDRRKIKKKTYVEREFTGLRDCVKKVSKSAGIKGLFKGYSTALGGIMIYRSFYFGAFNTFKSMWASQQPNNKDNSPKKPSLGLAIVFGQLATTIAGTISYPLDTVSRRLMMEAGRPEHLRIFTTSKQAFQVIYKSGGIRSFFQGVGVNILRGFGGALVLVFYDEVIHVMRNLEYDI